MELQLCEGHRDRLVQYEPPQWEPLLEAVGERLTEGFMWMHESELEDGTSLHAYEHIFTRSYLYLTEDGRAFELAPCGRYVPLRLDFAIERALCTWWILSGWTQEDADAVREAVIRSSELASDAS